MSMAVEWILYGERLRELHACGSGGVVCDTVGVNCVSLVDSADSIAVDQESEYIRLPVDLQSKIGMSSAIEDVTV